MPEVMAMRCAFFRLIHSLALRLLVTYIAALLVTMGCIAAAIWLSADQDPGANARGLLQKFSEILQKRMRFDPAHPPGIEVLLPDEYSWVFDEFATDAKYAVFDSAGHIIVASGNRP